MAERICHTQPSKRALASLEVQLREKLAATRSFKLLHSKMDALDHSLPAPPSPASSPTTATHAASIGTTSSRCGASVFALALWLWRIIH